MIIQIQWQLLEIMLFIIIIIIVMIIMITTRFFATTALLLCFYIIVKPQILIASEWGNCTSKFKYVVIIPVVMPFVNVYINRLFYRYVVTHPFTSEQMLYNALLNFCSISQSAI